MLATSLAVLLAVARVYAGDWPQWRGPDRSNASREVGQLKQWPAEGPPLIWRATGIGFGIQSVSVAGDRVFVVGNREGGEFVFALDSRTGAKLWAARVDNSIEENPLMRWLTQRSPTVDGGRLYTFTASGQLVCLRVADGHKLWRRSYPDDFGAKRPMWGYCDHPLVDGERLICSPFTSSAAIAALNKHTGEVIWQTALEDRMTAGYGALVPSAAGGIPQFVLFHGTGLAGFAADDGRVLWRYARPDTRIGSTYTPIPHGDVILSPNGYGGGLNLFRIIRNESGFAAEAISHENFKLDAFQDSTAVVNDLLYFLEGGSPRCVDMKTGSRAWRDDPDSRGLRAALTWADNHLYIRDSAGAVSLVRTSTEGAIEQGRFLIPEHEPSVGVTSPIVAGGRLWLRDNNRLFCYDINENASTAASPPSSHQIIGLGDHELGQAGARVPRRGVDRAPDAVFVPTPHDVVERILLEAGVKQSDRVVDLGSGDGRYVIAAAKTFGCRATGYEIDAKLVLLSREAVARENLGALASIEHEDIFTADFSNADVVTAFLYPRLMERLIPQLEKLKPGSRILSHQFEIPGIKPDRTIIVKSKEDGEEHRILFWTIPFNKKPAP